MRPVRLIASRVHRAVQIGVGLALLDACGHAFAALPRGEQVGLQLGAGSSGADVGFGSWLVFCEVNSLEQVVVAVEECSVDPGTSSDAGDDRVLCRL